MIGVHLSRHLQPTVLAAGLRLAHKPLVMGLVACCLALTSESFAQQTDYQGPSRAPHVRLLLDAHTWHGPWTITFVNEEDVPVRIAADARQLSLLVRLPNDKNYTKCSLPSSMRGTGRDRQLVLDPAQSYVETIDPRLYCWGENQTKLAPGASVTAFVGWAPDVRLEKRSKPQVAPFVVEPVLAPPAFPFTKQMASLTHWLAASDDSLIAQPEQPPARYVGTPDLRLSTPKWEDADLRSARISATLTNVGDRAALIHIRPDDLELRVQRPDGSMAACGPGSSYRAAVRDFFLTIQPGKSVSVSSLLSERCPSGTFERPGLYQLHTTLRARDNGSAFHLQAITGDFAAPTPTLLRLRTARLPFCRRPRSLPRDSST